VWRLTVAGGSVDEGPASIAGAEHGGGLDLVHLLLVEGVLPVKQKLREETSLASTPFAYHVNQRKANLRLLLAALLPLRQSLVLADRHGYRFSSRK
jgi:hypothetical protein